MNAAPVVVGEVGINHVGNLRIAKAIIAMCKSFGLDFVKFQKRTVGKVYRSGALQAEKLTRAGTIKLHDKYALEFGRPEYDEIDKWCKTIGIGWFASPWDEESLEFLLSYKPPYIKVASAVAMNWGLLKAIMQTGLPIILSICMSDTKHAREQIRLANKRKNLRYVLVGAAEYPTPDEKINLCAIGTLQELLKGTKAKPGFTCHSRRCIYPVAAWLRGAAMLEFHVTLAKSFGGDDQLASLHPGAVLKLREHLDALIPALGSGELGPTDAALAKLSQYVWSGE